MASFWFHCGFFLAAFWRLRASFSYGFGNLWFHFGAISDANVHTSIEMIACISDVRVLKSINMKSCTSDVNVLASININTKTIQPDQNHSASIGT